MGRCRPSRQGRDSVRYETCQSHKRLCCDVARSPCQAVNRSAFRGAHVHRTQVRRMCRSCIRQSLWQKWFAWPTSMGPLPAHLLLRLPCLRLVPCMPCMPCKPLESCHTARSSPSVCHLVDPINYYPGSCPLSAALVTALRDWSTWLN